MGFGGRERASLYAAAGWEPNRSWHLFNILKELQSVRASEKIIAPWKYLSTDSFQFFI